MATLGTTLRPAHLSEHGARFPRERGLGAIHPMLSQEPQNSNRQHPDLEPSQTSKGLTMGSQAPESQLPFPSPIWVPTDWVSGQCSHSARLKRRLQITFYKLKCVTILEAV